MPRGGARANCGRKATGKKTKQYCITFSENDAAKIEKIAAENNKHVNKFIRDAILEEYVYPNVYPNIYSNMDVLPYVAEDDAEYKIDK